MGRRRHFQQVKRVRGRSQAPQIFSVMAVKRENKATPQRNPSDRPDQKEGPGPMAPRDKALNVAFWRSSRKLPHSLSAEKVREGRKRHFPEPRLQTALRGRRPLVSEKPYRLRLRESSLASGSTAIAPLGPPHRAEEATGTDTPHGAEGQTCHATVPCRNTHRAEPRTQVQCHSHGHPESGTVPPTRQRSQPRSPHLGGSIRRNSLESASPPPTMYRARKDKVVPVWQDAACRANKAQGTKGGEEERRRDPRSHPERA